MKITFLSGLALLVILVGIGFSGWLTSGSLSGSCPIDEGCPSFLGYPACIYGLVMYAILLILFLVTWKGKIAHETGLKAMLAISIIGMLFAGSLLIQEYLIQRPLSVCAMGFVMYLLIFLLTIVQWIKRK
ncbi:MAG: hypothetical protein ABIJ92_01965 [Candidatus Aenigmatarchaeota archaeon]